MQKIVVATSNAHKVSEFREILSGFEILSLKDLGIKVDIIENGTTFLENAYIKARTVFNAAHIPTIADDSGLEVFALGGEPGIYSARYGGEGLDDRGRVELLLKNMRDVDDEARGAQFTCAIAFVCDKGELDAVAHCEGTITHEVRGENGFGYDPVFYFEQYGATLAEISAEQKNAVSHRGKALREAAQKIKSLEA